MPLPGLQPTKGNLATEACLISSCSQAFCFFHDDAARLEGGFGVFLHERGAAFRANGLHGNRRTPSLVPLETVGGNDSAKPYGSLAFLIYAGFVEHDCLYGCLPPLAGLASPGAAEAELGNLR